jgi:hypothetical protein
VIRQSQNYFAAAVSAALVNAAAITAFVLFTILSSVQGFGLRSVLDAVDSIGSPSTRSVGSDAQSSGSSSALVRDAGSGTARLVPNAGSTAGSGSNAISDAAGSHRGLDVADVKGGAAPGPSGSGGGTSGPGGSGGPIGGGPTLPSPSTGGPTGSLNIPDTLNNTVGAAAQGVSSATSGTSTGVTDTATGLLGTESGGAQSGRGASAPSQVTGVVDGAVAGASGAVNNTGVKLPGLN